MYLDPQNLYKVLVFRKKTTFRIFVLFREAAILVKIETR